MLNSLEKSNTILHPRSEVVDWLEQNVDGTRITNKAKETQLPLLRADVLATMLEFAQSRDPYLIKINLNRSI